MLRAKRQRQAHRAVICNTGLRSKLTQVAATTYFLTKDHRHTVKKSKLSTKGGVQGRFAHMKNWTRFMSHILHKHKSVQSEPQSLM